MPRKVIKPNLDGVVLRPGQRYLINTKTQRVFPYNPDSPNKKHAQIAKCMARADDMQEFFFDVKAKETPVAADTPLTVDDIISDVSDTEIEVEKVTVEVDPSTLTPAEKRKLTMAAKKGN